MIKQIKIKKCQARRRKCSVYCVGSLIRMMHHFNSSATSFMINSYYSFELKSKNKNNTYNNKQINNKSSDSNNDSDILINAAVFFSFFKFLVFIK